MSYTRWRKQHQKANSLASPHEGVRGRGARSEAGKPAGTTDEDEGRGRSKAGSGAEAKGFLSPPITNKFFKKCP